MFFFFSYSASALPVTHFSFQFINSNGMMCSVLQWSILPSFYDPFVGSFFESSGCNSRQKKIRDRTDRTDKDGKFSRLMYQL